MDEDVSRTRTLSAYVHVTDSDRFLLVRRDVAFPFALMNRREWRVIAVSAEPITADAELSLFANGYCAYRVLDPAKDG